jgi:hypothetical protein
MGWVLRGSIAGTATSSANTPIITSMRCPVEVTSDIFEEENESFTAGFE